MRCDFKWRLKLYRDEQVLIEAGMEFHVAGERRAVAEGAPTKINKHIWYLEKFVG